MKKKRDAHYYCALAIRQAGGPVKLSQYLAKLGKKISPQAISQWEAVPTARIFNVADAPGVSVTIHQLRRNHPHL